MTESYYPRASAPRIPGDPPESTGRPLAAPPSDGRAESDPSPRPTLRTDRAGWWRVEAGSDGEPDWKAEADAWRRLAHYYLGDYADTHTPAECQSEAIRRKVAEGVELWEARSEADSLRTVLTSALDALQNGGHVARAIGALRGALPTPDAECGDAGPNGARCVFSVGHGGNHGWWDSMGLEVWESHPPCAAPGCDAPDCEAEGQTARDVCDRCAQWIEAYAERLKHTRHVDGLGMGWMLGEDLCREIAAAMRAEMKL